MKRYLIIPAVVLCLLLSGCSWMDGSYLSVTPHQEQSSNVQTRERSASNYLQLRTTLEELVDSGVESAVINVALYRQDLIHEGMGSVALHIKERYPLGAYAVEDLTYEVGISNGHPAVSVNISYIHGRSQIRTIQDATDMDAVEQLVTQALEQCDSNLVAWVSYYHEMDILQAVEDYMKENPEVVMEMPQISVGVYPDSGSSRIVEVKFSYETSRESLRQMQQQVRRVFTSAQLYINSDATLVQKCDQLYTFLMERFDYQLQTSITPSYSLLSHGVGDSEAFASVYAAMCRQAGMDSHLISGTKNGKSWYWVIVHEDDVNYHIDLLRCYEEGKFYRLTDEQMEGYVWDYSAYGHAEPAQTEPVIME